MKYISATVLVCLGVAAFAQDVQFDYDRSANFNAYKTRSFPRISQPSQPSVSSSCSLAGGSGGGPKVPVERIRRIPSASA